MTDETRKPMDELRRELAQALGEDAEDITATNPEWVQLMREGVLIRLHVGRWRARTSLRWRDLGLKPGDEDEELHELLELGHKLLLPREDVKKLESIEASARTWLEKCSFRTHWGFFVPVTAYEEWKERNEELRQEYLDVRDRLADGYEETVAQVLEKYRTTARQAYGRLCTLHPEAMEDVEKDEFVERFVREIERAIPSKETFYDSFYFTPELEYIPLPSLLAEEEAEAERIRTQARLERERARAEEEKLRAEVRAARSAVSPVGPDHRAAEWKERMMREMHQDVIEQARMQKEEMVESFMQDVVARLRTLVYEAATDVLASIQRNDYLHPRSVVQLRNLMEQVERLNFTDDVELEVMLGDVYAELDREARKRDVDEMEQALHDVATVTRATLLGLGEQPRSAREAGIPDEPAPSLVREARKRLGLDEGTQALPERPARSRRVDAPKQAAMSL